MFTILFVWIGGTHNNMHSDDTPWKFTDLESGLSKCLVVFQYLSSVNKLYIVQCLWTIFFVYQ